MKLNRYLSYMKDIYIEFHDYSFIHSPSQGSNSSNRFIGRKKLKERIKDLLIKGETRSGAYLITGYRGIGKSSLVNQVIDELSPTLLGDRIRNRIIRIGSVTTLIAILWYVKLLPGFLFPYEFQSYYYFGADPYLILFSFVIVKLALKITDNAEARSRFYVVIVPIAMLVEMIWSYNVSVSCTFHFSALLTYAVTWVWLTETSRYKNDIKVKATSNLVLFFKNAIYAFEIRPEKYPKLNHYYLIQDLFCVASPVFLVKPFIHGLDLNFHSAQVTLTDAVLIHFLSLLFYLTLVAFLISILNKSFEDFGKVIEKLKAKLRDTINYSRRIHIRISLGQENLRELEILKILTKKVLYEYKKVDSLFWGLPFNLSTKVTKFIFLFVLLQIVSSSEKIQNANNDFIRAIHLNEILPSQEKNADPNSFFSEFVARLNEQHKNGEISQSSLTWRATLGYVDNFLVQFYQKARYHLAIPLFSDLLKQLKLKAGLLGSVDLEIIPLKNDFLFFSAIPNYLFVLYFITLWYMLSFIASFQPLGVPSHSIVRKKLEEINDRIDAQIDKEQGKDIGNIRSIFRMFSHNKKKYPIAGVKEIESELLNIFEQIDKIPRILNRPEFIIIMDELDKIGRHENKTLQDKESEENIEPISANESSIKNHQEAVVRLLANLKHFFTSAKAKFIFIAGREMYDASMADISDRNYFMGSIFHDVIYVNSFLTDEVEPVDDSVKSPKNHMSYHTTLVEEYVCQFLIPPNWSKKRKSYSLKTYREYLFDFFFCHEIQCLKVLVNGARSEQAHHTFSSIEWQKMIEQQSKLKVLKTLFYSTKIFRQINWKENKGWLRLKTDWALLIKKAIVFAYLTFIPEKLISLNGRLFTSFKLLVVPLSVDTINNFLQDEHNRAKDAEYILFHVRNFISYVTYRAGGAPKKIAFLIEQYLKSCDSHLPVIKSVLRKNLAVIVGKSSSNFFLHFSFYDLYTFGVMNYLTTPFLHSIGRHLSKNDDKLVVSSTYLLDHLYKFHDAGFSWRNIEVMPEIVDVNKSPGLRKIIYDIVKFMLGLHLDHVVSGLFDYRFNQRLAKEITLLSKVNTRESAALNFTLDESQEVKRHYKRKLVALREAYKGTPGYNSSNDYIHSIGLVHGSLGDLHYYDQEYDDAILQYKDAVQALRKGKDIDLGQLVVLTRLMLKLGLTFEKKKSFSSAMLTYENLSALIITHLRLTVGTDDLKFTMEIIDENVFLNTKKSSSLNGSLYNRSQEYVVARVGNSTDVLFICRRISEFCEEYYSLDFSHLHYRNFIKISAASSVRLIYQPFIAKFYLKEKEKIGGIKHDDLEVVEKEILFITQMIGEEDRVLILSEYKNKMGDILFYKNSSDNRMSCMTYYLNAIQFLVHECLQDNTRPSVRLVQQQLNILVKVVGNNRSRLSSDSLKVLANNVSDLGDAVLTIVPKEIADSVFNSSFFDYYEQSSNEEPPFVVSDDVTTCVAAYLLSAQIYSSIHEFKKSAFQYIKMLYIISQFKKTNIRASIIFIKERIANKAIEYIHSAYNSSTLPELEQIRRMLKDEAFDSFQGLQHTPSYVEIQKVIALYKMIDLIPIRSITNVERYLEGIGSFVNKVNPSLYSRLTVLHYKARSNFHLYRANSPAALKEHLIADSIYCFTSIIRILMTSGISYVTGHYMVANAYHLRGKWCQYFDEYESKNESSHLSELIKELIGSESFETLRPLYNFQNAVQHFQYSIEAHSGHSAYDDLIDKMFYLDDDYEDEYYHFHCALERSIVLENGNVSNLLKEKLERLETLISKQKKSDKTPKIFDADDYFVKEF